MANRVVVNICGDDYTLVAEESPSYMQKVAALVDEKMAAILQASRVNHADAAVLAAVKAATMAGVLPLLKPAVLS